ncbi:MAG TPA: hypothetical protein VLA88_02455 [Candidatus Saccharimonadales bacterium]|nr:hypothetical protein [Candidatus Saccharimonadales bacterium]
MSPEAVAIVLGLWWAPVVLQGVPLLAFIFPQFLTRDQDYTDKVKLYTDANKANLAKALKDFVTAEIDADIEAKCLNFVNEASRRFKLNAKLAKMGRIYTKLSSAMLTLLIIAAIVFTASLILVIINKQFEVWALAANATVAVLNLGLLFAMRHYAVMLQKIAGNEDLSE